VHEVLVVQAIDFGHAFCKSHGRVWHFLCGALQPPETVRTGKITIKRIFACTIIIQVVVLIFVVDVTHCINAIGDINLSVA
jgi:abortive infection bacteriophage resistance protein